MSDSEGEDSIVFALSPALVSRKFIDFSKNTGQKLFQSGIAPLSSEGYDLDPMELISFLSKVRNRVIKMGWKDIIIIPENSFMSEEEEQNPRSLIDQYG